MSVQRSDIALIQLVEVCLQATFAETSIARKRSGRIVGNLSSRATTSPKPPPPPSSPPPPRATTTYLWATTFKGSTASKLTAYTSACSTSGLCNLEVRMLKAIGASE